MAKPHALVLEPALGYLARRHHRRRWQPQQQRRWQQRGRRQCSPCGDRRRRRRGGRVRRRPGHPGVPRGERAVRAFARRRAWLGSAAQADQAVALRELFVGRGLEQLGDAAAPQLPRPRSQRPPRSRPALWATARVQDGKLVAAPSAPPSFERRAPSARPPGKTEECLRATTCRRLSPIYGGVSAATGGRPPRPAARPWPRRFAQTRGKLPRD